MKVSHHFNTHTHHSFQCYAEKYKKRLVGLGGVEVEAQDTPLVDTEIHLHPYLLKHASHTLGLELVQSL